MAGKNILILFAVVLFASCGVVYGKSVPIYETETETTTVGADLLVMEMMDEEVTENISVDTKDVKSSAEESTSTSTSTSTVAPAENKTEVTMAKAVETTAKSVEMTKKTKAEKEDKKKWSQVLKLDKDAKFELKISSEDPDWLVMEMSGPTQGYVSIGFSPDGGMNGSDIVMGWVDAEGKAQLKDLHGIGNTKPKEDPEQNYELLSGSQTEERTTIQFRRRWSTPDQVNDKDLKDEKVVHVIYAYNKMDDPNLVEADGTFKPPYHFTTRGVLKNVNLKGTSTVDLG